MNKCETCKWWHSGYIYRKGHCRRRSPDVSDKDFLGEKQPAWPLTDQDDYCGDHEMKAVDENNP